MERKLSESLSGRSWTHTHIAPTSTVGKHLDSGVKTEPPDLLRVKFEANSDCSSESDFGGSIPEETEELLHTEITVEPTRLHGVKQEEASSNEDEEQSQCSSQVVDAADGQTVKKARKYAPVYPKRFACDRCGKAYASPAFLARHTPICENSKFCHLCTESFKNDSLLKYHLNKHKGERAFPCRTEGCDKAYFNPTHRSVHERTCGKTDEFVCTVCGVPFRSESTRRTHFATHSEPKHECEICGRKFFQRPYLKRHLARHSKEMKKLAKSNSEQVDYHSKTKETTLKNPCENEASSDSNREAANSFLEVQIKTESNSGLSSPYKRSVQTDGTSSDAELDSSVADPETGKATKRPGVFPKLYSCDRCDQSCTSLGFLRKHKRHCSNPVVKACPMCPEVFKKGVELRYHMNKHTGERPYRCRTEGCGKAFFRPAKRYVHEKTCVKQVQYSCTVCKKSLSSDSALRNHVKTHDEPTFGCMICGKMFHQKNNSITHWKVHFKKNVLESGNSVVAKVGTETESKSLHGEDDASEELVEADYYKMAKLPPVHCCDLCGKGFPTEGIVSLHKKYCSKLKPPR